MDQLYRYIIDLAGKFTREEIANKLGTSRSTVNRCLKKNNIKTGQPKSYPINIRNAVINFYASHTLKETQKQFPNVKVRSIIERYTTLEKQNYWTFEEELKAISMLSEKSTAEISKILGRGKRAVSKRIQRNYQIAPKHLNGIAYRLCKHVLRSNFIPEKKGNIYIVNWNDFDKYISTKNKTILECVKVLAKFRTWLCQIS